MASDAKNRPVYVISVAAELVDMHPQTLRLYERKGLIRPGRSSGKTRLYSERDIEHLREIRRLTQELGVNLAGVEEVMRLQHELDALQDQFEDEIQRIEGELHERIRAERALPGDGGIPTDPLDRPVYVISIAAQLVDMHPQTLRLYERKGLIRPGRSSGKTRLYSERDIEHLREIRRLTQELGVNLAGVEEIMRLRHNLDGARARMEGAIDRIQQDLTQHMTKWRELPATEDPERSAPRLSLPPGLAALTELGDDDDAADLDDLDDLDHGEEDAAADA
ncbi:heat shock protein transcriptional repressor HspR, fused homodimer type [Deinococcus pimensis]|uniref:heat shock protein transcriptional repressor HspR, fused homodimer type n=1 Tax=Deinococcus pimensis TaxID=309888 RepID=UPI0004B15FF1|nr:helix-turn-helix transcriptional regulator [Deinococcus pimensis]